VRRFAIVAGGILAFAGAGLLVVWRLTADAGAARAPPVAEAPPQEAPRPPPPPAPAAMRPPQASVDPKSVGPQAPAVLYAEPPPAPPPGSWEAVRIRNPRKLGHLGASVGRELNALQPRLSACFDEARARGGLVAGADNYTETQYGDRNDGGGVATLLILQIETLQDRLRIVEAPVEAQGIASYGTIACAQRVLRGHTFPAPGARPGERMRVQYSLMQ
jgi:hypothetical protein